MVANERRHCQALSCDPTRPAGRPPHVYPGPLPGPRGEGSDRGEGNRTCIAASLLDGADPERRRGVESRGEAPRYLTTLPVAGSILISRTTFGSAHSTSGEAPFTPAVTSARSFEAVS